MSATATYRRAVLFGGTGFIGAHLARYFVNRRIADDVVLADLKPPTTELGPRIAFVQNDVRREIPADLSSVPPDLIVNLAAIHREPGHQPVEYFETNIRGAETVCRYAAATGCKRVVFTSSIAVYGPTEEPKDETSLPVPVSAYGASKLVAEQIHLAWQRAENTRRLVTVRPGVIFGPGEQGNVTRLLRAVTRGYFVYCGNHHVRKAGGYVKELCNSVVWAMDHLEQTGRRSLTYNFSMDPTPRLEQFVAAIAEVAEKKKPRLSVPFLPILAASHIAKVFSDLTRIEQPLHPARARKLVQSNHIGATILRDAGYTPSFTLTSALRDWRACTPQDWGLG
jgi:nucleoside-diphosphate-sugar epimerase